MSKDHQSLIEAQKTLSSFKMTFEADEETFKLVMKCFKKHEYPFQISSKRRKKFNDFMVKYIIDESYLWSGYQLYTIDDLFREKTNF
jgi:hypothetical protein